MFPETDDFEPDERPVSPAGNILPFVPRHAPDWLTGPGDDLDAAAATREEADDEARAGPLPGPVLLRPVSGVEPGGRRRTGGAGDHADEPAGRAHEDRKAGTSEPPARPAVWGPVASSVPILRLASPAEPEPTGEGPVMSTDERPATPPGRAEDLPRSTLPRPPLTPLEEPWWLVVLDTLRTSRPVQFTVAATLASLVLLVNWMWPRGVGSTSLSEVRRHPSQYDGRVVVVRGRVGDDVFAVGGGWAFYLMQGRDTIVTFTRRRTPKPYHVVTVRGQVSTGFLDGAPRQALFEETADTQ